MTAPHRHRVSATSRALPYCHCANPARCNPAAHGGMAHLEVCRCGASRVRLLNGGHGELGPWTEAK